MSKRWFRFSLFSRSLNISLCRASRTFALRFNLTQDLGYLPFIMSCFYSRHFGGMWCVRHMYYVYNAYVWVCMYVCIAHERWMYVCRLVCNIIDLDYCYQRPSKWINANIEHNVRYVPFVHRFFFFVYPSLMFSWLRMASKKGSPLARSVHLLRLSHKFILYYYICYTNKYTRINIWILYGPMQQLLC